jgi:hypothetical protein
MSTTSKCTKTSADSSWGLNYLNKEIFINLSNNEIQYNNTILASQDSCDGPSKEEIPCKSTDGHIEKKHI